jgi:pyruvate dehydrogenase (quinone)
VLPDDLPFVTGTIGLLGTKPSYDMMMGCDTLLMIGSTFPSGQFLPKVGQARGVQIDIDGRNLSLRYPMELNLIGDSAETLRALIPHLQRKADRSWREKIEADYHDWWKVVEARSMESADPLNPQRVFWELSQRLHGNIILSGDAGTATNWYGNTIKMRRGMLGSLSGSLATMGSAVPYAIAAKFAYPDRIPIALTGDGAMQMNDVSGDVTTIPPHISFEEAKNYASALLKGDPHEGGIIKESIKSVVEGVIPHKH